MIIKHKYVELLYTQTNSTSFYITITSLPHFSHLGKSSVWEDRTKPIFVL